MSRVLARRVTTKRLGASLERMTDRLMWAVSIGKVTLLIERPNSPIPSRLVTIDAKDLMP